MKHLTQFLAVSFALIGGLFLIQKNCDNSIVWFPYLNYASRFPLHSHLSTDSTSKLLMNSIEGDIIKENLRLLTKEPHIAGTEANDRVGDTVARLWNEAGLEDVHMISYDVLLSYPGYDNPNRLFIQDEKGREVFSTSGVSPVLIPDEQGAKHAGHQWLAYSAAGVASGEVVYANRGSPGDFEYLRSLGIDMKGRIALMRFGEGFRGDKVYEAQLSGATGAILFSDPDDVARDGPERVFPKTYWMPTEGVQRGSVIHGSGDPLTPLYPSKKGFYRSRTAEEARLEGILPSIPVLPISYTTAYQIFSRLKGIEAPMDWQGGVNVTYRIGPGFAKNQTLRIEVHGTLETRRIRNVVGYIKGSVEPDRYVMLGNHYDAWVYGSIDPNSGTAILAEMARAMVDVKRRTGWKPARTIMFTAWDGEEHFLLGSTEFVEEYVNLLQHRAVAYLNMDCLYGNTSLHVTTTPTLYSAVISAAEKVTNPNRKQREEGKATVYDSWIATFPSEKWSRPEMPLPGGGSDHAPFLNYAGIPVVDFKYRNATTRDNYPLYHSLYETPFVNEHLLDTDEFSIHTAVGQFWTELARKLADEPIIPLNTTELAVMLLEEYLPQMTKELEKMIVYKVELQPAVEQMNTLVSETKIFLTAAKEFEAKLKKGFIGKEAANDRIMQVERCFINPRGMPGAPQSRHVLFSVSSRNSYSSSVMAAVQDSISEFLEAETTEKRKAKGRAIAHQLSIVLNSINCVVNTLSDHI